jgi:hypothetical protein
LIGTALADDSLDICVAGGNGEAPGGEPPARQAIGDGDQRKASHRPSPVLGKFAASA